MPDELQPRDRNEFDELARTVRDLSDRVRRLERRLGDEAANTTVDSYRPPPRPVIVSPQRSKGALESRIGMQWLNRIGVVAVLFGVAYLLRYVSGWVSAQAWVWLGVAAGIVVIAGSEWFRARGYRVLSLSLKSTGVGVTYLSLWAGLELYRVLPAPLTFAGLGLLTLLTATLALRETSQLLAALALIGGFLTPLLISVPSGESPLFFWLLTLDCAAAAVAKMRDWWKLLPLSLGGTAVLSVVWYFRHYNASELLSAAVSSTIFFVIFCLAAVWVQVGLPLRRSAALKIFEVVNVAFYFVALYLLLSGPHDDALTAAALALSAIYFWQSGREDRRANSVARAVAVYGGLGIAFLALALAVLLDPEWLSLGWFVEAALIIAFGFWRDLSWMRWGALALLCAAVVKAFAYDVWQLSLGYRTLSFIGLGVLLLVISFVYQRHGFAMISKGKTSVRDSD